MTASNSTKNFSKDIPDTLKDEPFYGMILDEEQQYFRDKIWDKDTLIVIADARAGTGKTTIAVGTANLLVHYGRYDGIVYIASPTMEQKQGYLPGTIEDKSEPYFDPLYEAMIRCNINRNKSMVSNITSQKNGTAFIECITHTFLRGTNFENKVIIIDEAANYYTDELKKVLTRIHDSCKTILIGHTGQVDLYKNRDRSGFKYYLDHFSKVLDDPRVAICTLSKNYRGWLSNYSDELIVEY